MFLSTPDSNVFHGKHVELPYSVGAHLDVHLRWVPDLKAVELAGAGRRLLVRALRKRRRAAELMEKAKYRQSAESPVNLWKMPSRLLSSLGSGMGIIMSQETQEMRFSEIASESALRSGSYEPITERGERTEFDVRLPRHTSAVSKHEYVKFPPTLYFTTHDNKRRAKKAMQDAEAAVAALVEAGGASEAVVAATARFEQAKVAYALQRDKLHAAEDAVSGDELMVVAQEREYEADSMRAKAEEMISAATALMERAAEAKVLRQQERKDGRDVDDTAQCFEVVAVVDRLPGGVAMVPLSDHDLPLVRMTVAGETSDTQSDGTVKTTSPLWSKKAGDGGLQMFTGPVIKVGDMKVDTWHPVAFFRVNEEGRLRFIGLRGYKCVDETNIAVKEISPPASAVSLFRRAAATYDGSRNFAEIFRSLKAN